MRRALFGSLFAHAAIVGVAFAGFQWPEAEDAPAPGSVEVELVSLATVSSNSTSTIESSAAQSLTSAGAAESEPLTAETIEPIEPTERPAPPLPIEALEAEVLEEPPPQEIDATPTAQAAETVEPETVEPLAKPETLLVATAPRVPVEILVPVQGSVVPPRDPAAQTVPETVEPVAEEDVVIAPVPQTLTIARRSEPTYPPRRETPPPQQEPRREPPTQAGNGGQADANVVASRASAGQQGDVGSGGTADVARYKSQIESRLRRALRYPAGAGGAAGEVYVTFTVAASGAAGGIGIARSSGNAAIDRAGIETVERAAPFPAIPPGAGRQTWTFTVPLAFVR